MIELDLKLFNININFISTKRLIEKMKLSEEQVLQGSN
jgi:hypothetical protein